MAAPVAKVFVWKSDEESDEKLWKVGTEAADGVITVRKEFDTYQEAWDWLHENYRRDTA